MRERVGFVTGGVFNKGRFQIRNRPQTLIWEAKKRATQGTILFDLQWEESRETDGHTIPTLTARGSVRPIGADTTPHKNGTKLPHLQSEKKPLKGGEEISFL